MTASLGGLDGLVFTAGIGEHAPEIRSRICARCSWLGVVLDESANRAGRMRITAEASRIRVYVIPGRFNLAQGIIGTASGIGASLSTTLFGLVAVSFGRTVVFLSIASVALLAVLILWFFMPETRPSTKQ